MGLRLETYNENFVGLIVDFSYTEDSQDFCSSNNVDDAIAYFDLYIDEETKRLKKYIPSQKIVDKLAVSIDDVEIFQEQLTNLTSKLTDEEAILNEMLFANWSFDKGYEVGDRVRYDGILYKCLAHHTAEENQVPGPNSTLWLQLSVSVEPEEWMLPEEGQGYSTGTKVLYNGIVYESQIDNNVWEPGSNGTESLWAKV